MGKIAFLFPGQGSQQVGMGRDVIEQNEIAKAIYDQADTALDVSLSELILEGPEETLKQTANTQPALVTTSVALLKVLEAEGIKADMVAGHSLGEYSALVAAGALTYEEAVKAVRARGQLMENAVPNGEGAMAAVLGMARDALQTLVDAINEPGHEVELANMNAPGQIVISGSQSGVEKAAEQAKEQGAKRVIPLNVSGPFHSSLMKPAAEKMRAVLDNTYMNDAHIPVVANVNARETKDAASLKAQLIEQIYSPVLWEDTVRYMLDAGVDTFIEIGPGKVLSGLVRKVQRRVNMYAVEDMASLQKTVEKLKS